MTCPIDQAAVIGGGVIGGGWVARFLLSGVNVALHDPNSDARRTVEAMLDNARRAHQRLVDTPPVTEGVLTFHDSVEEAVAGASYIQENVPERLEIKHDVIAKIEAGAAADALIGSSTSGFKPSELQAKMQHPERLVVAHPFNPVYLVPLVEVVGSDVNTAATTERVSQILAGLSMHPLVVRREIEAHIADRLLEAVWREGLWLIHDDIATTQEIDDAIRYGFGLRWAQMGLFETYRIAGGEAGMKHFIEQFGPALAWPWTKLMDVPEMTDELAQKIADQSDAQSGQYSIRELERIRDDNLVGILQALKSRRWGAGETLARWEEEHCPSQGNPSDDIDPAQPLALYQTRVKDDWIDYNGHMTEHRYLQVFGDSTDAFLAYIGMDKAYLESGHSVYTVESHLRHTAEVGVGAVIFVTTRVLGCDAKRVRILHEMTDEDGQVLATAEHMLLHVNTNTSRACPFLPQLAERLAALAPGQSNLEAPAYAGAGIRMIGWANKEVV
ncbi:carnitine 3-dehydrogenase [Pseudovibrio exalbescens]|uniref:L-carnitine dehydrogenase n=1 Tax=Pseudovibrio exalbescens TaxID=197461 RepID=A0A1U7JHN2_9HYPH|nr:carnitine 3-dehydrogenase [Pseudovibrio exalbescens]OKL44253.1 3-hydroxyacyl-CoA dehydrogenase [Pseudovibrio exalbescens]